MKDAPDERSINRSTDIQITSQAAYGGCECSSQPLDPLPVNTSHSFWTGPGVFSLASEVGMSCDFTRFARCQPSFSCREDTLGSRVLPLFPSQPSYDSMMDG
jgi:hypothetical protein